MTITKRHVFVLFLLFMLFYINKFHNYKQTIVPYQLKILEFTYVVLIIFFGERTILLSLWHRSGYILVIYSLLLTIDRSFQTFLHNLIVRGSCSFQMISCLYLILWYLQTTQHIMYWFLKMNDSNYYKPKKQ